MAIKSAWLDHPECGAMKSANRQLTEIQALQESLRKARHDSENYRRKLQALDAEIAPMRAKVIAASARFSRAQKRLEERLRELQAQGIEIDPADLF
ncbi:MULTISPECIES: hypothetical protein [unclassified Luteococcus]|uniref:hypothetical protein n=1 Tax=unclassified Luteococcus TaxID=2639923 RepID=UPI00313B1C35